MYDRAETRYPGVPARLSSSNFPCRSAGTSTRRSRVLPGAVICTKQCHPGTEMHMNDETGWWWPDEKGGYWPRVPAAHSTIDPPLNPDRRALHTWTWGRPQRSCEVDLGSESTSPR